MINTRALTDKYRKCHHTKTRSIHLVIDSQYIYTRFYGNKISIKNIYGTLRLNFKATVLWPQEAIIVLWQILKCILTDMSSSFIEVAEAERIINNLELQDKITITISPQVLQEENKMLLPNTLGSELGKHFLPCSRNMVICSYFVFAHL